LIRCVEIKTDLRLFIGGNEAILFPPFLATFRL